MLYTEWKYKPFFTLLIFFCLFLLSIVATAQEEQRYNRFQYHKFHWRVHHGSKVNIYFPADAADSLYKFILKEAPVAINRIKKATISDVPNNLNIIVYPSILQMYETNIGSSMSIRYTIPTFTVKGTRIVLAYNGSYEELKGQLEEGVVRALWDSQLKEGEKEDKSEYAGKKEATSSKGDAIPFWFREGTIRHFAHGWTIEAEDNLRKIFEQNSFMNWKQVINHSPRLGGHAFCYFLTQNYYKTAVAQTFFQLMKKKSLPRAIRLVTKHSLDTLFNRCFTYYNNRFGAVNNEGTLVRKLTTMPHKRGIITTVLASPGNDLFAYISLRNNKRTVYVYNIRNRTTSKIAVYKMPPWIDNHIGDQYPIIQWHKDGRQLFVAVPRKGILEIKRYTLQGKWEENTALYGVEGINSLQPLSDRHFLLSAYRKGQSDIVSYNENQGKYVPYTDDEYDDSWPEFTGNGDEVLFISNRPQQYQAQKTFLIGVGYRKDTLWQGVYTINGNELKPIAIDSTEFVKWDKPVLLKDGQLLVTTTQYGSERNVLINYSNGSRTDLGEYKVMQYLPEIEQISFFRADKDSIYITQEPLSEWIAESKKPIDTISPWLVDYHNHLAKMRREDSLYRRNKDTTHYLMDEIFAPRDNKTRGKKKRRSKAEQIERVGVKPYVLQLHSAYFTAQVNNDYFINKCQPFKNYMGQYKFPELSGMTKGGFTDLFENHHFTVGYALPASTEGSTFFMRYENTERKVDWGLLYFRKVETLKPDPGRNWVDENGHKYPQNAKDKIHYYEFFAKKPISYDCGLGLQIAVRQDRTVFLATDVYSLRFPPIKSAWSINTLSFKLNKLHPTIPYLFKGYQINAFTDLFKGFSENDPFLFGTSLNVRYDLPIYKYITVVSEIHVGYSGGDAKMLYNLGGVDNNVTPRVDTSVRFQQNAPYAFQTLITPFRGYYQNSLYGNQYALLNIDAYFPIFQTLIPIETPLAVINNIQLGLLTDLANGRETWNESNPQNNKLFWAYGLSARSVLAGYPLRIEVAWPGTFNKQPVWYFSLNLQ